MSCDAINLGYFLLLIIIYYTLRVSTASNAIHACHPTTQILSLFHHCSFFLLLPRWALDIFIFRRNRAPLNSHAVKITFAYLQIILAKQLFLENANK